MTNRTKQKSRITKTNSKLNRFKCKPKPKQNKSINTLEETGKFLYNARVGTKLF